MLKKSTQFIEKKLDYSIFFSIIRTATKVSNAFDTISVRKIRSTPMESC